MNDEIELKPYLNVGCGSKYHMDWYNLDYSSSKGVKACNVVKGLPYPNDFFEVVYCSHFIEHIGWYEGRHFIDEVFRVLRPKGILRLATPDLEKIAKEYITNLENWGKNKTEKNRQKYEWILLELIDQMVRKESGGNMIKKIREKDVLVDYVLARTGDELLPLLKGEIGQTKEKTHWIRRLLRKVKLECCLRDSSVSSIGCGENHQWYYDRVSLQYMLEETGFKDFVVVDYKNSSIPDWENINLDKSENSDKARKPDSIIVEAKKTLQ